MYSKCYCITGSNKVDINIDPRLLLLFFPFAITRNYWRQLGSLQLTRIWTILLFRQWWNGTRPGWGLCSFSSTHYFAIILLFYLNKKTLKMRISCWSRNNQLRRMGCLNFFWHPQWLDILVFFNEGVTQMLVLQLFHWFYCNVKEPTSAPRLIKTRDYRPQWCWPFFSKFWAFFAENASC